MKVNPEKLLESAEVFSKAKQDTDEIFQKLTQQVEELSEEWEDANQQVFFQYFSEWRQQISGFSDLLSIISREMEDMADRYKKLLE